MRTPPAAHPVYPTDHPIRLVTGRSGRSHENRGRRRGAPEEQPRVEGEQLRPAGRSEVCRSEEQPTPATPTAAAAAAAPATATRHSHFRRSTCQRAAASCHALAPGGARRAGGRGAGRANMSLCIIASRCPDKSGPCPDLLAARRRRPAGPSTGRHPTPPAPPSSPAPRRTGRTPVPDVSAARVPSGMAVSPYPTALSAASPLS